MGCWYPPLRKIVYKALGRCNGRERWREERLDYAMAYPPTEIHYMRPVARTVTFASTNSVYVIPPEQTPPHQPSPSPHQPSPPPPEHHHHKPQTAPQHEPEHQQPNAPQPQQEPPAQTPDAPQAEPKPPKGPRRGKKKQPGRVRFGPEAPPPQEQEKEHEQQPEEQHAPSPAPPGQGQHGHGHWPGPAHGQGFLFRYTPSPLARWEATPRRHEYFSGEYRSYYPTPVREGIYRIATDANRLSTIFSEENPNACTIA